MLVVPDLLRFSPRRCADRFSSDMLLSPCVRHESALAFRATLSERVSAIDSDVRSQFVRLWEGHATRTLARQGGVMPLSMPRFAGLQSVVA